MTGREVFVQSGIKFPQVIYIKLLSFLVKKNHGFSLSDFFFSFTFSCSPYRARNQTFVQLTMKTQSYCPG